MIVIYDCKTFIVQTTGLATPAGIFANNNATNYASEKVAFST